MSDFDYSSKTQEEELRRERNIKDSDRERKRQEGVQQEFDGETEAQENNTDSKSINDAIRIFPEGMSADAIEQTFMEVKNSIQESIRGVFIILPEVNRKKRQKAENTVQTLQKGLLADVPIVDVYQLKSSPFLLYPNVSLKKELDDIFAKSIENNDKFYLYLVTDAETWFLEQISKVTRLFRFDTWFWVDPNLRENNTQLLSFDRLFDERQRSMRTEIFISYSRKDGNDY